MESDQYYSYCYSVERTVVDVIWDFKHIKIPLEYFILECLENPFSYYPYRTCEICNQTYLNSFYRWKDIGFIRGIVKDSVDLKLILNKSGNNS